MRGLWRSVVFQQHSVFDDYNGKSLSYIPRKAECRFQCCFDYLIFSYGEVHLSRYSEQHWTIYPIWSTLSSCRSASLQSYIISRCKQLHRRHVAQAHIYLSFGKFQDTERFLHCERNFSSRLPPSGGTWKYAKALSIKKNLERFSTY